MNGGVFKRRAGASRRGWILTILVAILAAAWGRLLLQGGPRFSDAAITPGPAASIAVDPDESRAAHRAAPALSLANWAKEPAAELGRNLFAVPLDTYPPDPAHPPQSDAKDASEAKLPHAQADQIRERQRLIDAARTDSATLTLEGTVLGDHPRAWFNGLLVGVGENIGASGFRVASIESRRVFIERDGVRIEISMK